MSHAGNERGQGMTEYLIIAILVGLVVLFSINRFGAALRRRFGASTATVNTLQVTDTNQQSTRIFESGLPEEVDLPGPGLAFGSKDFRSNAQQ